MSALDAHVRTVLVEVPESVLVAWVAASHALVRAQAGCLDALKQRLRERLVECGWRDELKEQARDASCPVQTHKRTDAHVCHQCRQLVRQRGYENLTVDQLVKELAASSRGNIPETCVASCSPVPVQCA